LRLSKSPKLRIAQNSSLVELKWWKTFLCVNLTLTKNQIYLTD
jgi:hypothetical protein